MASEGPVAPGDQIVYVVGGRVSDTIHARRDCKMIDPGRAAPKPRSVLFDDVSIVDLDRKEQAAFYRSVWGEIFLPVGDWFDGRLVVLAGQDYVEALGSILEPGPWEEYEVILPFEDTDGNGEQLAWLTEELESREQWDRDDDGGASETEQTTLVPDGGRDA